MRTTNSLISRRANWYDNPSRLTRIWRKIVRKWQLFWEINQ